MTDPFAQLARAGYYDGDPDEKAAALARELPARRPVRNEKMRLVFVHPCGAEISNATTDPVKYGSWCPRCTPDPGTADFDFPPSQGWVQVFHDEPAPELPGMWEPADLSGGWADSDPDPYDQDNDQRADR